MLFGGFIGYLLGNVRGQQYRHVVGFFTGWIARHQGEGIPVHYAEVYHPITDIGVEFGGKDHTTVMHACSKIRDLLARDERFRKQLQDLTNLLTR